MPLAADFGEYSANAKAPAAAAAANGMEDRGGRDNSARPSE